MPVPERKAARPLVVFMFLSVAFLLGMLMALQARINGQLGLAIGNKVQASLISFSVGLVALIVLFMIVPSMRGGLRRLPALLRERTLLPWHLLGGIAGACFILAQVHTVPLIGVALFTVVGVAAESITALIIDRFGLSPAGKYGLSFTRVAAAVLVILAVILASFDEFDVLSVSILALGAVFLARIGTTIQVTFNAKVAFETNSYLAATLVSFLVGTIFLFIIFLISTGSGTALAFEWQPWWLYLGGIFGLLAIAGGTVCIPKVGVLLYGLAGVGGSIIGSLLIDVALPFANAQLSVLTLFGSVLALVGIVAATEPIKYLRLVTSASQKRRRVGVPRA